MDRNKADLLNALRSLIEIPMQVFPAVVKSVQDDATCTVDINGLEHDEVRLRSVIDSGVGFIVWPKAQSKVLVGRIGNGHDLYVVSCSEVDKVTVVIDTTEFALESSGVKIKRGDESIMKLLTDLIEAIKKIQVSTGSGPSGTPLPPNISELDGIKNRLPNLFIT